MLFLIYTHTYTYKKIIFIVMFLSRYVQDAAAAGKEEEDE
jgi:hypothetical protein